MDLLAFKELNLALTQQNQNLRQQITAIRNDRLLLQHHLFTAIEDKESFKIEVIKLITQTQNTFERLKTFIEHTTSTPPRPLQSGTEKLQRRQIVGARHQHHHHHHHPQQQLGVPRQIPIYKDAQEIPATAVAASPPTRTSVVVQNQNDDMRGIDEKIHKLSKILKKYKRDNDDENNNYNNSTIEKDEQSAVPVTTNVNVGHENRRRSERLKSGNVSLMVSKQRPQNKENLGIACAFKDITNEESSRRFVGAQNKSGLNNEPAMTPGKRKRKPPDLVTFR